MVGLAEWVHIWLTKGGADIKDASGG